MKKLLLIIGIITTLISCGQDVERDIEKEKIERKQKIVNDFIKDTKVIDYDSCEYLLSDPGSSHTTFTHKGNCKFCEYRKLNK